MHRLAILPLIFALGCGSEQEEGKSIPQPIPAETIQTTETPYGDSAEVQAYLVAINPFIQEVGKIHLEINKAVGSSGKATSANLAPAMEKAKPRIQKAIKDFSLIPPPPLLAPLHADIKRLMVLRLNGYESTIRGWAIEKKEGKLDPKLEAEAENALREANQLINKLNQEMSQVYKAMEKVSTQAQTASP